MPTGTVSSLHRWPVKSFAGEPADALVLGPPGVAGDRAHALQDEHRGRPRRLTARQAPRMLAWRATYPGAPADALDFGVAPPLPHITAPDGATFAWDDPALTAALADDLGRRVTLARDPALMQDLAASILVTTQATLDAMGAALGRALDLRRFRTNIHVVLDDAPPFAENGWDGHRLRIGEAVLQLLHPCGRCVIPTRDPDTQAKEPEILRWLTAQQGGVFGINARAAGRVRVAVGDPVTLLEPGS